MGPLIYQLRWVILLVWIVLLAASLPFLPHIMRPFQTTGFVDDRTVSAKATTYIDQQLGYHHNNKFIVLYHSPTLLATQKKYAREIKKSLSGLKNFPIPHDIFYPINDHRQISQDKHTAYVIILLKSSHPINGTLLKRLRSTIKTPTQMTVQFGGEPVFVEEVNKQTEHDLSKADCIATPVAIITLILVFGSIVSAILPVVLGAGCALIMLTTLYFLGHIFSLSIFTLNIALLLGLCLSLDYSLFVISRFRDELNKGQSIKMAITVTQNTAGKAIFFSGLAVFASLSALLLFPINILFSVAIGGLVAVCVAVFTATIVLPALLSVLKTNINRLPVRLFRYRKKTRLRIWHWIARQTTQHPRLYFVPTLVILLCLGYPFLSARFGVSDFHIFPEHSSNRQFFDTYSDQFQESELSPITLLIRSHRAPILSRQNLSHLYDMVHTIQRNPSVKSVHSIVNINSHFTKTQYDELYHSHPSQQHSSIKKLLATTTGKTFTVIHVISKYGPNSPKTHDLIQKLHHIKIDNGLTVTLTGSPVDNIDVLQSMSHLLPYAILWIILFTYLILLFLLRSLFLPIKAILMNLLSLSACYGALVLVFQEGYLHHFLNFEPQHMLDLSLLVIIFCALFGFSMDYEVFLLTRIKEHYDATHHNDDSIVFGIEKSSRIITSAALIVMVLCGSFLIADVLMVKAFGLGIAVAIFVDAFLIRTILVPTTMAFLKQWNWYLPKWLDKILPMN